MAEKVNIDTKFRKSQTYTSEELIRDLLEVIADLNAIIARLEARIAALEP